MSIIFRGVRPFGVSLLIAGWDADENVPYLYQCDPSVGFCFKYLNFKIHLMIYVLYMITKGRILCMESNSNWQKSHQWKNILRKEVTFTQQHLKGRQFNILLIHFKIL